MTESAERLKPELSRLSPRDRAELARFLLRSLDAEADAEADAAWDAELIRRAEEIRSGKAIGESADRVLAELREKHS